jgi:predicted outer membrane repeat protein
MRKVIFALAIVMWAAGAIAADKIIYVDSNAGGANVGSSWANAINALQDAILLARFFDEPVEIRVAQGIYTPDRGLGIMPGDREASFQLLSGVTIKGGYAGFGATDPNARDVKLYETTLSGDLNGDDVQVAELEKLLLERTRADNSYHVVTGSGADATAVLDGFILRGGNAISDGGGMLNESGNPTIDNCTFIENSANHGGGGGMSNYRSSPTLTNCTFRRNSAKYGGGISCGAYANPTIINCIVSDNLATMTGGGLRNSGGSPTLISCTISGNTAMSYGGGIYCIWSEAMITNCTISENWSWSYGGGIFCEHTPPTINDCLITGNWAYFGGGGISCLVSNPVITNCAISSNKSIQYHGGGIYCGGSSPNIVNCLFAANEAAVDGGAIHCFSSIYYSSSTPTVTSCTIVNNLAGGSGGGISCENTSSLTAANCIVWGNLASYGPEITLHSSSQLNISYSNVRSGRAQVHVYAGCVLVWGEGNIDVDPCFVEPSYWDLNGTPLDANDDIWVDGDYSLKSQAGRWDPNSQAWVQDDVTSPCVDVGDPNSPIGLEPFPNGGIVNMGAYGGTAQASKSYFGEPVCETIVAGDINGDCKVDFADFAIMALHWLDDNNEPQPAM